MGYHTSKFTNLHEMMKKCISNLMGIHHSHYGNTFHVFYRANPVVKSVLTFE